LYEKDQLFPLIVSYFMDTHLLALQQNGNDSYSKACLEVSLDFLEFLLTSLPESLVDKIEGLVRWLLWLKGKSTGKEP
jgi:hypothetical protein